MLWFGMKVPQPPPQKKKKKKRLEQNLRLSPDFPKVEPRCSDVKPLFWQPIFLKYMRANSIVCCSWTHDSTSNFLLPLYVFQIHKVGCNGGVDGMIQHFQFRNG